MPAHRFLRINLNRKAEDSRKSYCFNKSQVFSHMARISVGPYSHCLSFAIFRFFSMCSDLYLLYHFQNYLQNPVGFK